MKNSTVICLAMLAFAACSQKKESEAKAPIANEYEISLTDAQLKNAGIETDTMESKEISSILKLNGQIEVPPQNMVSVSAPLGGYVKTTKLLPGMQIRKGEAIATLEDMQFIQLQEDYLTARAKIGYLEKEYQRQKELNKGRASSDKVYQQAAAEYQTQRVLLASLAQKLQLAGISTRSINERNIRRRVNVYSPIHGYVSKVNVNIGQYVSPTDVLFELVNLSDVHLALKVFEKDVAKLQVGQALVAYTNNQPEQKYPCKILLIGKDLNAERNTDVHCHFETFNKELIPGTYMNAEVEVKNAKASVLPAEAVVRYEGKHFVFEEKTNKSFRLVEVHPGETHGGFTEINFANDDAKNATSKYVTKGAYSLLMMMKNKSE